MCGIVGGICAADNIVEFLADGLGRLEYRGYDSSGIAVIDEAKQRIERVRRVGRVKEMRSAAAEAGVRGRIGIGHTRWATHGGVNESNAHPHISRQRIVVVHNGIIENFEVERARLAALGYTFESQTDTETIAHAIEHEYSAAGDGDLFAAVRRACARLQGAYAIAVMAADLPQTLVVARMGCPLLVGLGEGEVFLASDVSALVAHTRRIVYLDEGDVAELAPQGIVRLLDREGAPVRREEKLSQVSLASLELGPYSHFMQKEIHEQPRAIADTCEIVLDEGFVPEIFGAQAASVFRETTGVKLLACGTS